MTEPFEFKIPPHPYKVVAQIVMDEEGPVSPPTVFRQFKTLKEAIKYVKEQHEHPWI